MSVSSRIDYWVMDTEELVGVFLTPSVFTQYQCPNCRFIYRDFRRKSCPKCNEDLVSRETAVYNTAAYGYLKAISVLLGVKKNNENRERGEVIERVQTEFGIVIGWDELTPLVKQLCKMMGKTTRDPQENYRRNVEAHAKMVKYVRDRYGISDDSVAGRLYGVILNYRESYELDGPILAQAVTLSEALFDHFLLILAESRGRYEELEGVIFKDGWVFETRKKWFNALTARKLDDYLNNNDWTQYVNTYKIVKERRNKFVHGFWMAVSEDTMLDALKCAGASFDLVAELNNTFCVRGAKIENG